MKRILQKFISRAGWQVSRRTSDRIRGFRRIAQLFDGAAVEVAFDVGANQGAATKDLLAIFPNAAIHSFEPFEPIFREMKQRLAMCSRVKPVNLALGSVAGEGELQVNASSVTNSLLLNAPEAQMFQPQEAATPVRRSSVQVETLDRYCVQNQIEAIDLLKVDTQGYDLRVLQGAQQLLGGNRIGCVYCEVLFVPLYAGQSYFQELYQFLTEHGFRLVQLYDCTFAPEGYIAWADALFINLGFFRKETRRMDCAKIS
jgi:FkbM family methyltransferase